MKVWRIDDKAMRGALGRVGRFAGQGSGLSAAEIIVLESANGKFDAAAVCRLASKYTRSVEMWWDGNTRQLRIVACARDDDMEAYVSEISSAYDGIQANPLQSHTPEWFNDTLPLYYSDWSWDHGHFALALEKNSADVLSELATRIQKTKHAWVQVVFRRCDASDMFRNHANRLEGENARLTREKERLELENKRNGQQHKRLPDGRDAFQGHFNDLIEGARQKRDNPCVMMSIRCVYDTGYLFLGNPKSGPNAACMPELDRIRSKHDRLVPFLYGVGTAQKKVKLGDAKEKWAHLFRARSLPGVWDLKDCIEKYCSTNIWGNYQRRVSPPFLMLAVEELPLILKMPSPKTANLNTTNNPALPKPKMSARGLNIGFMKPTHLPTDKYHGIFGKMADSNESGCAVLPPELFQTHIYVPGMTGHGKTTIIQVFQKHLEMLNIFADMPQDVPVGRLRGSPEYGRYLGGLDMTKTVGKQIPMLKNAFIFVDPKGDDSEKSVRACEPYSFERKRVRYLDPVKTGFSINPLELPPDIDAEEREAAKSRYVGYILQLMGEWFGDRNTFVRLQRIIRAVMFYLYDQTDSPTLKDMYGMVQRLQRQGKECLPELFKDIGEPKEEIRDALYSIADFEKSAFDSVLNRLEPFVLDGFMKDTFCSSHSSVSPDELIQAGSHTIIRLAQSGMAPDVAEKAIQALVLKLWFAIQERSDRARPEDQVQVVLVIDEFQVLKDIGVLERILEQARSKKLCLILAHQTLSQLDDKMLNIVLTNCGFQVTGKLIGHDAARLADAWDPASSGQLKQKISTLEKYRWIARGIAVGGKEQSPPVEFWTHFDRDSGAVMRDNMTYEGWSSFVRESWEKNIARRDTRGLLGSKKERRNEWLAQVEHGWFPEQDMWKAMVAAAGNPMTLKEITGLFGGTPRDKVREMCSRMVDDGLLRRVSPAGSETNSGGGKYETDPKAISKYLTFDPNKIGSAEDVPALLEEAVARYLERGCFIAMARQGLRAGKDRVDLVGYDYERNKPIAVEIESKSEVNSHWEHVEKNMGKWSKMGFDECDVWSYSNKIMDIATGFARKAAKAKRLDQKGAYEMLRVAGRVTVYLLVPGRRYRSKFILDDDGVPKNLAGQETLQDAHFGDSEDKSVPDPVSDDDGKGEGEPPSEGDPDSPSSDES